MAEKKLSKKALNKSFRNWFYGHLTCFSQEHMQTFGYLCAMLPLVEELYDTKEEQTEALKTYSAFFNTEPQLGTVIVGMTAGLEEAKANGEDIDGEMINGIRAGLMGPVAGIGDSLLVGTLIPILLGVALGLSSGGSPLGAIFYIIAYNVILTLGMRLLYFKGYELGGKAVEMIVGEKANAIRESIIMLGTVVIGAVAASWISITTPLVLPGDISLQKDVLDTIFPKLLPLATVMLCYWLMSKKKMAPTTVMLVLVGIALVFVYMGATFGVKYTSLSNSGFLCGMTVVFTPLLGWIFLKQRQSKKLVLVVLMCLVGIALLTLKDDFSINTAHIKGDLLCLMCAVAYAIDLLLTEKAVAREEVDAYQLGVFQLGVTGVCNLLLAFLTEQPHLPTTPTVWGAVLFLSVFCTGVAFVLQPLAQRYTTASHTGVIFALEPVFAAFVAAIFANEILSVKSYFGAALMVASLFIMEIDFSSFGKSQK